MCEVVQPFMQRPNMSTAAAPLSRYSPQRSQSYQPQQAPLSWSDLAESNSLRMTTEGGAQQGSGASYSATPARGSFLDTSQSYLQRWMDDISSQHRPRSLPGLDGISRGLPQQFQHQSQQHDDKLSDTGASLARLSSTVDSARPEGLLPAPSISSLNGNNQNMNHTSSSNYNNSSSLNNLFDLTFKPHPGQDLFSGNQDKSRRGSVDMHGASTSENTHQIALDLQIPLSINASRGSIAEFAAKITCLFWFETSQVLSRIETGEKTFPAGPLVTEAVPSTGFTKWVTTLLSTTQVSQQVTVLALLFIYRLKKLTYNVKGKAGSEYRLLTVALMLGNKFLDDNTYTNKTWADVSGISVGEIHVMEVEFLSNMKYNLFTSEQQWHEWHIKLGRFGDYLDRAATASAQLAYISPLISPPLMSAHSAHSSPLAASLHSPLPAPQPMNGIASRASMSAMAAAPYLPQPAPTLPTPYSTAPQSTGLPFSRPNSRKRSRDDTMTAPPPKRMASFSGPSGTNPFDQSMSFSSISGMSSDSFPSRLPMPMSTPTSVQSSSAMYAPSFTASMPANLSMSGASTPMSMSMPPSRSNTATSFGYQVQQSQQQQQQILPNPLFTSTPPSSSFPSSLSIPQNQQMPYSTNPYASSNPRSHLDSQDISPTSTTPNPVQHSLPFTLPTPSSNITPSQTPSHHNLSQQPHQSQYSQVSTPQQTNQYPTPSNQTSSPLHHLMNRNSPYKPVRSVNTLLVPPPQDAFTFPAASMDRQNMLYQPLSKRPTEPRQGPVPYYETPQIWYVGGNGQSQGQREGSQGMGMGTGLFDHRAVLGRMDR